MNLGTSTVGISQKILSIFLITVLLGSFFSFPVYAAAKNPETPVGPPGVPAEIQELQDKIDDINAEIAALKAEDVNLQNQIDDNDVDIAALETRLTDLENDVQNAFDEWLLWLVGVEVAAAAAAIACAATVEPSCAVVMGVIATLSAAAILVLEIIDFNN